MKAIILAAGRGSRLQALTDERPKALVAFNGVPLLQRAIETLRRCDVSEVGIVAGYRSEMLAPFADTLFHNHRWHSSGIFSSLNCASSWLSAEPCLVSYGDIFYDSTLVSELINHPADIVLGYDPAAVRLWQQRFNDPLPDLENFRLVDGLVSAIGQAATSLEVIQGQYMGLFKVTPAGWQALKKQLQGLTHRARDQTDMTSLLGALVSEGFPVAGVATHAPWGEIDCPSDVTLYERIYPDL